MKIVFYGSSQTGKSKIINNIINKNVQLTKEGGGISCTYIPIKFSHNFYSEYFDSNDNIDDILDDSRMISKIELDDNKSRFNNKYMIDVKINFRSINLNENLIIYDTPALNDDVLNENILFDNFDIIFFVITNETIENKNIIDTYKYILENSSNNVDIYIIYNKIESIINLENTYDINEISDCYENFKRIKNYVKNYYPEHKELIFVSAKYNDEINKTMKFGENIKNVGYIKEIINNYNFSNKVVNNNSHIIDIPQLNNNYQNNMSHVVDISQTNNNLSEDNNSHIIDIPHLNNNYQDNLYYDHIENNPLCNFTQILNMLDSEICDIV